MLTGSAPISVDVLEFMKVAMCCPFYEGYGQTENTGAAFVTDILERQTGHVGGPVSGVEFKVEDVPEMNYYSTDKNEQGVNTPRGEICLRGPIVFLGYYKEEQKTSEAVDKDGWLHTGDIGVILPNGALKITDRKKNIFKLSQGEYVAPEKVEQIYAKVAGVENSFLHGDSLQHYCLVIVSPTKIKVKELAD